MYAFLINVIVEAIFVERWQLSGAMVVAMCPLRVGAALVAAVLMVAVFRAALTMMITTYPSLVGESKVCFPICALLSK